MKNLKNFQNAVNVKWRKEGGQLPLDRTVDDNNGVLVIRELKVTDSGVYVCEVSDGINIGFKKVTLTVGGSFFLKLKLQRNS